MEALETRDVPSTLTVTNPFDRGPGSLRYEIAQATTKDTIVFAPSLAGQTIGLTSGELDITQNLSIQGPGADQLKVSGDLLSRVFEVDPSAKVALSGMTISDGVVAGVGGGILNNGTLAIADCTISNNLATGNVGGGLTNWGTLAIADCTISNNQATGNGGGIINLGTLNMDSCTFVNNRAGDTGAGLFNLGMGTVARSRFQTNVAGFDGGGLTNWGLLTVRDSCFTGNSAVEGGGIANTLGGGLTVIGCDFTNNTATGANPRPGIVLPGEGGAIYNSGTLDVHGSDFSGNSASDFGGAIYNLGTATVQESTLSANSASAGGGLFNAASGTLAIDDSVVCANVAPLGADLFSYSFGAVAVNDSTVGSAYYVST
jgi:predicted outer membrane repeat protein